MAKRESCGRCRKPSLSETLGGTFDCAITFCPECKDYKDMLTTCHTYLWAPRKDDNTHKYTNIQMDISENYLMSWTYDGNEYRVERYRDEVNICIKPSTDGWKVANANEYLRSAAVLNTIKTWYTFNQYPNIYSETELAAAAASSTTYIPTTPTSSAVAEKYDEYFIKDEK